MKIAYIITDTTAGSNIVKGIQVAETLSKNEQDVSTYTFLPDGLENQIIVFVGSLGQGHKLTPKSLEKLKQNGNKVVVDPVDSLCYINLNLEQESQLYTYLDGIIFPNTFSEQHFMQSLNCKSTTIHHHYDLQIDSITVNKAKEFSTCYAGAPYRDIYFEPVPSWLTVNFGGHTDEVLDLLIKTPVHFSHRSPQGYDFYFKPGTKLATACAVSSIFVTSKDKAVIDLLGEDYPLYIDEDFKKTTKLVQYLEEEFNRGREGEYVDLLKNIINQVDIKESFTKYVKFFKQL